MTGQRSLKTFISEPQKGTIYVAEYATKRSAHLTWSAMPELRGADYLVEWYRVPVTIRKKAREFFHAQLPDPKP